MASEDEPFAEERGCDDPLLEAALNRWWGGMDDDWCRANGHEDACGFRYEQEWFDAYNRASDHYIGDVVAELRTPVLPGLEETK